MVVAVAVAGLIMRYTHLNNLMDGKSEVDDFTDFLELPASLRAALPAKRGEITQKPRVACVLCAASADFEWLSALSYHRRIRAESRSGTGCPKPGCP